MQHLHVVLMRCDNLLDEPLSGDLYVSLSFCVFLCNAIYPLLYICRMPTSDRPSRKKPRE
jgi:hypothetical protein